MWWWDVEESQGERVGCRRGGVWGAVAGKRKQYKENGRDTLQRVLSRLIMQQGWERSSHLHP